ncbi:hypothetical protein AB2S31_17440 [Elizabethkingia anophelis]|uniref:hypothetical protein n=1 Tax=Elizabethkingia anophelis TaxID=1117645 RepID=UPI0034629226
MNTNLLKASLWGILLVFIFYGCRTHDDAIQQEKELQGSEYVSKSLWKEDEKYIKNVKAIFEKNADIEYFHSKNGVPYWNYATTMGVFNESFLEVPIVKNKTVAYVMVAERLADNKVYFRRKDNSSSNDFFNLLIFKDRNELNGKIISDNKVPSNSPIGIIASTGSMTCYTIQVVWTWSDESTGEVLSTSTTTETRCQGSGSGYYPAIPSECLTENCEPNYDYGGGGVPTNPVETPCASIEKLVLNPEYQKVVNELDRTSVLSKSHETGYSENKGGTFTPLVPGSDEGRDFLTIPIDSNTKGFTHTHLNDKESDKADDEGLIKVIKPIRMFSPADVNTLMTIIDTNKSDTDFSQYYGSMISSSGNYIIKFTGTASDIKMGFDTDEWREKYAAYIKKNKGSLERIFLNFLRDEMQVSGISLYEVRRNGKKIEEKVLSADGKKVGIATC